MEVLNLEIEKHYWDKIYEINKHLDRLPQSGERFEINFIIGLVESGPDCANLTIKRKNTIDKIWRERGFEGRPPVTELETLREENKRLKSIIAMVKETIG